jgi:type I restriction enzyme S subunit
MTEENKSVKNFPNLRFPGFEREWEERKLEELIQIQSGFAFKSEYFIDNGNKLVIPKNFTKYGYGNFDDNISKFSQEQPPKQYKCKEGDLLILLTDLTPSCELLGKPLLLKKEDGEVWLNQRIIKLLIEDLKLKNWLFYYFQTEDYLKIIKETSTGSTVRHSSNKIINQLQIFIPNNPEEQQKISSFITLVDSRIQTQKKIIEDTCKMKLKLSHNLFTQNFRINRQYISKWKEKTLGDISAVLMGQSPDSSDYNTDEKGLPLIQGNADIVQRFSQPRQFTSQITKTCDIGDIILTVRAPVGYVAKSKHFACIGRGVCAIKSNEKSDSEFIYQFLLYFENKWSSFEQGSTFTSVNSSDIKTIKINVPTIEEQREIAQFLKTFDEKINIETELLTQYENQKKYLLQNLFV